MPSFIKLPRNKQFNFKPRYYDAQKEEIEQRIAIIKAESEEESGEIYYVELARYKMSKSWKLNETKRRHFDKSNMRIALIAGVLITIFYFYLYY